MFLKNLATSHINSCKIVMDHSISPIKEADEIDSKYNHDDSKNTSTAKKDISQSYGTESLT